MFSTRDLAIYGAIVGTLGGAWTLYVSVILDRARIRLSVVEGQAVTPADIARQLTNPLRLGEAEGHTFVHGQQGGYRHGTLPTTRWYVVDGGGFG